MIHFTDSGFPLLAFHGFRAGNKKAGQPLFGATGYLNYSALSVLIESFNSGEDFPLEELKRGTAAG